MLIPPPPPPPLPRLSAPDHLIVGKNITESGRCPDAWRPVGEVHFAGGWRGPTGLRYVPGVDRAPVLDVMDPATQGHMLAWIDQAVIEIKRRWDFWREPPAGLYVGVIWAESGPPREDVGVEGLTRGVTIGQLLLAAWGLT